MQPDTGETTGCSGTSLLTRKTHNSKKEIYNHKITQNVNAQRKLNIKIKGPGRDG